MKDPAQSDWRVWQDPEVAGRFADRRRGGLLGGDVQLETMVRLLAAVRDGRGPGAVLDLGCGDGVLLEAALTAFPDAEGVALDGSPAMLERASARLAGRAGVQVVETDFDRTDWRAALPRDRFDAVVSGFAIHHSENERKRELYGEVWELLTPGGVFVNVEHVASATPFGERLFEEAWVENVARFRQERGEIGADYAAALAEFRARPDKAANRLAPVGMQLGWLREVGYRDVDCYWKHFELAVLAGYRP